MFTRFIAAILSFALGFVLAPGTALAHEYMPTVRTDVYVPTEGYGSDAVEKGTLYVAQIPYTPSDPIILFVAVPDESPEGASTETVYEDGSTVYTDGWVLDPDSGPNNTPVWEPPTPHDPNHSDIELGA